MINIVAITIIFIHGYLGPRLILCSLSKGKNNVLYISKEELLKQKKILKMNLALFVYYLLLIIIKVI